MAEKVNGMAEPDVKDEGLKSKLRNFAARAASIGLTFSPSDVAAKITQEVGLRDEKWMHYTTVEVINNLHKPGFEKIPRCERLVFIPHCLRNVQKCKAKQGPYGPQCAKCGGCVIGEIAKECEKRGMQYYIVGGGSIVQKIIEEKKPRAVLGIACYNELKMAIEKTGEKKISVQAVLLSKDGCVNTEVNMKEVL
ncbi:MAG: DUF116 domain-containing protein, partial [Candidatus Micrarchaeota archaeon]|nr:DUF116 domain-containing protein [Candidatus Micrarchaeota archaeon]